MPLILVPGTDLESVSERFWKFVPEQPENGCWLWTGYRNAWGYGCFNVSRRSQLAHRVSFELEFGGLEPGELVLHRCDTPACVRPLHLFRGDNAANTADRVAKGRTTGVFGDRNPSRLYPERLVRGEQHHKAKLTQQIVEEIRSRRVAGENYKQLAAAFGISKSQAFRVVKGEHWKPTCR